MNFLVSKELFLKLFKLASLVVIDKKNISGSSVVGSHVLLQAKENSLSLIATDSNIELIVEEPLNTINQPGSAVVPFRKITDICRAMTDKVELLISVMPTVLKLKIESTQGFFSLNYLKEDIFPSLSQKSFYTEFSIRVKLLQTLISKTAFAMGDDESRLFLNGVFLQFSTEEIVSVATDGHRLVVWEAKQDDDNKEQNIINLTAPIKILLPKKSVFDILKIFNEGSTDCWAHISVGENHVKIIINNITFTSKLLAATFPPFKKLIPNNLSNILKISREQLRACFLRAAALLGDKSQGVRLSLSKNMLHIIGRNEQDDLVEESVIVDYSGIDVQLCFNIKYLLDFLSNIDSNEILFKIQDSKTGALMQDPSLQSSYVIMPMQI